VEGDGGGGGTRFAAGDGVAKGLPTAAGGVAKGLPTLSLSSAAKGLFASSSSSLANGFLAAMLGEFRRHVGSRIARVRNGKGWNRLHSYSILELRIPVLS
jgi:hypothetical protein